MTAHSVPNISLRSLPALAPRTVRRPIDPALARAVERLQQRPIGEVVEDLFFVVLFSGFFTTAACFVSEFLLR